MSLNTCHDDNHDIINSVLRETCGTRYVFAHDVRNNSLAPGEQIYFFMESDYEKNCIDVVQD